MTHTDVRSVFYTNRHEVCSASKMTHTDVRSVLYTYRHEVCFVAKLGSRDMKSVLPLKWHIQTWGLFCTQTDMKSVLPLKWLIQTWGLFCTQTDMRSVLNTNRREVCYVHIQSTLLAANRLHEFTCTSANSSDSWERPVARRQQQKQSCMQGWTLNFGLKENILCVLFTSLCGA